MKINVGAKLISGFIAVSVIALIVGIVGITNITKIDNADTFLYEKTTVPIADLNMMTTEFLWEWADISEAMFASRERIAAIEKNIVEYRKIFAKYSEDYKKTFINKNDEDTFSKYLGYVDDYYKQADQLMGYIREGKKDLALAMYGAMNSGIVKTTDDENSRIAQMNTQAAKETSDGNTRAANRARITMILVIALAMLVAMLLGVFLSRAITKPLIKGVQFADLVAVGDLSGKVDIKTGDELETLGNALNAMVASLNETAKVADQIADQDLTVMVKPKSEKDTLNHSFKKMVESLSRMVKQVLEAADQVAASSEELSKTAQGLATGAQKQAAALEEASSSMEEMSSSVEQVSEKAQGQAASVEEVTSSMEELSSSIKGVSDLAANVKNGAE
jgi:methyl-accepting chemotaxis protein